ncbi:MAG: exonuclease SbcCD subunit D [Coriobacteriia bacterium]|nr:exonuclease SbcCD subunit D [Coriobacteriia bacterium]
MSDPVRFVHAADLHLDAPFKGVDADDPRVREALVAATLGALDMVVETCLERDADFLVLAGDVYDSADKPLRTEFALRAACARLDAAGIRVFIARGNHDPASGHSAGLEMPSNVHVFAADAVERVVFEREGQPVCSLYGRSFRTAAERENLAAGFSRQLDDTLAIGVLHANVGGREGHGPYAPCSLDDLRAARMDYWALGHIHRPEVLSQDPPIVYSGCTQGLHPGEAGPRGCTVVTLDENGATLDRVSTAQVSWATSSVCIDDLEGIDAVREALAGELDRALAEADGVPVVVRLELTGRSAAHSELARVKALDDLLADIRATGLAREPWAWVDRLKDHTRPAIDLDLVRVGSDFAADLVALTDALLADEDALDEYVATVARPILGALDSRDVFTPDARSVIERARDRALDRLMAEEQR